MNISICLHPKVITNKYTGERMTVRCGKCAYCRNLKAQQWIQRLEQESKCHRYTVFFTLTYSNDFIPTYKYDSDLDSLVNDDVVVSLSDLSLLGLLDKESMNYIYTRKQFNSVSVTDIQKFIKRLRYIFNSRLNDTENKNFRYYICSEYGPTTIRAHYHGVLWFESEQANMEIKTFLSSAWSLGQKGKSISYNSPIGIVDCSNVSGNAASYVARYVNSISTLPRLYQYKDFRPFAVFSRHPAIGTLPYKDEVLQKIVDSESSKISVWNSRSNEYQYIPLWRSVEDRLFPRYPKYSSLSDIDRISLYNFYLSADKENFRDFIQYVSRFCLTSKDWEMIRYLRSIVEFSSETLSGLYHFYLVCKRIEHNSVTFGYSAHQYIQKISRYYDKKSLDSLSDYFEFKQSYFNDTGQVKHLIMMDENFYRSLRTYSDLDQLTEEQFNLLDFYDSVFEDFSESPKEIQDYKDNLFRNNKIQRDSCKTKKKNEYLNKVRYNTNYSWLFKHY